MASTGLNVEEPTEDGDTSLTLAAEAGLVDSVKTLLQYGASPHNTNSKNESPLLIGSTNTTPCMHRWLFQLPNTCCNRNHVGMLTVNAAFSSKNIHC